MRPWRAVAAAGALAGCLVSASGTAQAEIISTPPGSTETAQVSLAMDNDWQFASSECLVIPVLATYGRADDTSILGELAVTKFGSTDTLNEGTFLVLPGDPVGGQVIDTVFVCPADGTGQFTLNTTVRAIQPSSETALVLDPLTFWVRPAASRMSNLRAVAVKGGTDVRGRVRAGEGNATGIVVIRYKEPGATRWSVVDQVLVEDGRFSTRIDRVLPPRTRVKATLTSCSWCSRVSASAKVR